MEMRSDLLVVSTGLLSVDVLGFNRITTESMSLRHHNGRLKSTTVALQPKV